MAHVAGGEFFSARQRGDIEQAAQIAQRASGLTFAAFVGDVPSRDAAEDMLVKLPKAESCVLVAVDPQVASAQPAFPARLHRDVGMLEHPGIVERIELVRRIAVDEMEGVPLVHEHGRHAPDAGLALHQELEPLPLRNHRDLSTARHERDVPVVLARQEAHLRALEERLEERPRRALRQLHVLRGEIALRGEGPLVHVPRQGGTERGLHRLAF